MEILMYLLKFNLHLIIPEELINFKLNTIFDNSLYIKFFLLKNSIKSSNTKKLQQKIIF